ncbi:hypothetical protein AKG07_16855 [Microbacterium sp. CGR1]|nr:hypothetical protein AKG07_16855 [Microbacterium sp. CGR1]
MCAASTGRAHWCRISSEKVRSRSASAGSTSRSWRFASPTRASWSRHRSASSTRRVPSSCCRTSAGPWRRSWRRTGWGPSRSCSRSRMSILGRHRRTESA